MREILSFRNAKDKITDAIKDFKKDPITNLGIIFSVLAGVVAGIGFVIALIMFIQNGGFTTQIDTIKDGNIYGEGSGFTTGTVSVISGGIVGTIVKVLLGIQILLMLVNFFKEEHVAKKVIMILDVICFAVVNVAGKIYEGIGYGRIRLTHEKELELVKYYTSEYKNKVEETWVVAVLVMLLIAIVLLFFSECRELLKYTCVSGAISFGGFPLLLLLVENVIPLVSNIVFFILLGIIICVIFHSLGSESGGSYDSAGSSSSYQRSESSSNRRAVAATKKVSAPAKKESNQPIVKNCSGDVKIYRKECTSGWDGWGMIVFAENPYGATTRLCSYEEFKTGKVQINLNGKRVTQIAEVVK